MIDAHVRTVLWNELGAAMDMLENAITACPEALWGDRDQQPEYWYLAYHTLFFLDFYLSDSEDGFAPPAPFGLEELDPAGVLPERVFTKDELLRYLEHGREQCRRLVASLTDQTAREVRRFISRDRTLLEWLLLTLRHVQHHTAQLNLILRQQTGSAPEWVGRTEASLRRRESAMNEPDGTETLRLRPRPSGSVELRIPSDTLEVMRKVAASRDMSPEALLKFYVGQGLRQDASRLVG